MSHLPDTLTLEQVDHLRRTLPQMDFSEITNRTIDVDRIIRTQVRVIDGVEVFVPEDKPS
jgi:hypothetical protein